MTSKPGRDLIYERERVEYSNAKGVTDVFLLLINYMSLVI